ncbi:MAG: hemolysin family protein [Planctomycetota bacterium]
MLADALIFLYSRTQLEDVLDKARTGPGARWFCEPFLTKGASLSHTASILSVLSVGAYVSFGLLRWGGTVPLGTLLALLGAPLLVGASLVNAIARLHTEETLVALARPLWFLTLPFRPLGALLSWGEARLLALFAGDEEEEDEEDREEIIAAVTDGEHEGVVEEDEREMIVNIFDLKNSDLSDIMTPRTDVCAISIGASVEDAVALALERGFSRIPVYEETRDNIRGIFHVKDALELWGRDSTAYPPLGDILRPPIFVPETKNVGELLRELQERKTHIAVVLDEYGGTAGVVTIEDVVEEIVGEILDEYDTEEDVLLREVGEGIYDVDARTHVHDMNEALGARLLPEDRDYETIGGFILDQLGHIPAPNENLVWSGVQFTIVSSDERKVGRVRVRLLPEQEAVEAELPRQAAG